MRPTETRFFAPQAWVNGAWAYDVLLTVDATGHWSGIAPGASPVERADAQLLAGPMLRSGNTPSNSQGICERMLCASHSKA